jgi:hypothetical protein
MAMYHIYANTTILPIKMHIPIFHGIFKRRNLNENTTKDQKLSNVACPTPEIYASMRCHL